MNIATTLRKRIAIGLTLALAGNLACAQVLFTWNTSIKGLHDPTLGCVGVVAADNPSISTLPNLYQNLLADAGPGATATKQAAYNILVDTLLPVTPWDSTIKHTYNGTDYYFSASGVAGLDTDIINITSQGINVTAILLMGYKATPALYYTANPVQKAPSGKSIFYGFNASTPQGLDTFSALMDFLVRRYSASSATGLISGYILGNEIQEADASYNVATAGTGPSSLSAVALAYSQAMGAAWNVIQGANPSVRVYASLDRNWTVPGSGGFCGFDFLNTFVAEPGMASAGWGVAFHPYSDSISSPPWADGDATMSLTTEVISMRNIEVLSLFLNQPGAALTPSGYPIQPNNFRLPNGAMRRIILSEQGNDSSTPLLSPSGAVVASGQEVQAAVYAYDYIRASRTPGIDAFDWATHMDEAGFARGSPAWYQTGLLDGNLNQKAIWNVFQAADTPSWRTAFDPYLSSGQTPVIPASVASAWNDLDPSVCAPVAGATGMNNESFRCPIAPGQDIVGGFYVEGGVTRVLIRAEGPSLAIFGVATPLPDPALTVYDASGAVIGANTRWGTGNATAAVFSSAGAFQFAPGSTDSAIVVTLGPGAYTVSVASAGGHSGNALFEIYGAGAVSGAPTISNFSARGHIHPGAGAGTAGFNVTGSGTKALLIRADGPTLAYLTGESCLPDPTITIASAKTGSVIAQNSSWGASMNSYDTLYYGRVAGAFDLAPGSNDAALFVRLHPGGYTVTIQGASGDSGDCLFEIYDVGQ